jgi:hypothetical protein
MTALALHSCRLTEIRRAKSSGSSDRRVNLDASKLMDGAEEGADMAGMVESVRVSIRTSTDRSEVSLPWELATTEVLASAAPWRTFRSPRGVSAGRRIHLVAEAPQPGADFADQDLGLLESCEVSALVGLAVVDQVAVGVFDPASRQAWNVSWEHGHRDR